MSGIDYFAWLVLIVIILAAVYVFVALARLPGQVARKRGHPQADAINVAGWIGLLTAGVVWVIAIIWAHMKPLVAADRDDQAAEAIAALEARIAELETQLAGRAGAASEGGAS